MTLAATRFDFLHEFMDLKTLQCLKATKVDEAIQKALKKIELGKIVEDSFRFIPLRTGSYAMYHKEACIIEDEASFHAFSLKKTIKKFILFDPKEPFIDINRLKLILPMSPSFESKNEALCYTWNYPRYPDEFFAKVLAIHRLAEHFFNLFPTLCPQVYDIQLFSTESKSIIRSVCEVLPQERVQPSFEYKLTSLDGFIAHVQSIITLLKTLFEQKIAHGDLTECNLIIHEQGGIKALLDFDTACTKDIMHGLYIKSWVADLLDGFSAMIFYQKPELEAPYNDKLTFETSLADENAIKTLIEGLRSVYTFSLLPLKEHLFISDHVELSDEFFEEFFQKTDPSKLFLDFDS